MSQKNEIFKRPPKTILGKWYKSIKVWWVSLAFVAAAIEKKRNKGYKKLYMEQGRRTQRGGLILSRQCTCGNYKPTSLVGLINSDCKNCGGSRPEQVYG